MGLELWPEKSQLVVWHLPSVLGESHPQQCFVAILFKKWRGYCVPKSPLLPGLIHFGLDCYYSTSLIPVALSFSAHHWFKGTLPTLFKQHPVPTPPPPSPMLACSFYTHSGLLLFFWLITTYSATVDSKMPHVGRAYLMWETPTFSHIFHCMSSFLQKTASHWFSLCLDSFFRCHCPRA